MNPYLAHISDRELLEQMYLLLLQINTRVNDAKVFGMNLAADLMGTMLQDTKVNIIKQQKE